jgi:hypothetical protein
VAAEAEAEADLLVLVLLIEDGLEATGGLTDLEVATVGAA